MSLATKIAELSQDEQEFDAERISNAWGAIYRAAVRDVFGEIGDNDPIDVDMALDDLEMLGVIENKAETLKRALKYVQQMKALRTQERMTEISKDARSVATNQAYDFDVFAKKFSEKLHARRRQYAQFGYSKRDVTDILPGNGVALKHIDESFDESCRERIERDAQEAFQQLQQKKAPALLPDGFWDMVLESQFASPNYADKARKATKECRLGDRIRETEKKINRYRDVASERDPKPSAALNALAKELKVEPVVQSVQVDTSGEPSNHSNIFRDTLIPDRFLKLKQAAVAEANRLESVVAELKGLVAIERKKRESSPKLLPQPKSASVDPVEPTPETEQDPVSTPDPEPAASESTQPETAVEQPAPVENIPLR